MYPPAHPSIRLSVRHTQELKPSRTFRLSEVVAYESTLPLSQPLPARTNMRYATVVSFKTSGEEGLGLTRVRLKTTPTHFIHLLSSEIFTFKVRTWCYIASCWNVSCDRDMHCLHLNFASLIFFHVSMFFRFLSFLFSCRVVSVI